MTDQIASYRRLFGRFATGVAVVLAEEKGRLVGLTVNSLTSVSLDPLLLLFCARNESESADAVLRVGRFSVNILSAHQENVARHFSGPRNRELKVDWHRGNGYVWVSSSAAIFNCQVEAAYPGGDHRIIIGRVVDMFGPDESDRPLLYHRGHYIHLGLPKEEHILAGTKR